MQMQKGSLFPKCHFEKIKINYLALHITVCAKRDLIKACCKVIVSHSISTWSVYHATWKKLWKHPTNNLQFSQIFLHFFPYVFLGLFSYEVIQLSPGQIYRIYLVFTFITWYNTLLLNLCPSGVYFSLGYITLLLFIYNFIMLKSQPWYPVTNAYL